MSLSPGSRKFLQAVVSKDVSLVEDIRTSAGIRLLSSTRRGMVIYGMDWERGRPVWPYSFEAAWENWRRANRRDKP